MSRRTAALLLFLPLAGALALLLLNALLPIAENGATALALEAGASALCAVAAYALCAAAECRLFPQKGERPAFPAPCPPLFAVGTALCFLVALNNLPFLALLSGRAQVSAGIGRILLFACSCLATAAFEELFFRGLLFTRLLRRGRGVLPALLLSSAIFGVAHLFNLAAGASAPETLLQVGYSFLVGCAAALLYLFSRSIAVPVLFHALYNFGGLLVPRLGSGTLFDTPTVIFTAVLAVMCAFFLFRTLFLWEMAAVKEQFLEKTR